ncbi:MAG: F0F1 ATP synthase subunit B [Elusimicrobiaceae bacterium]|nr:F0F1 ATP synthase subunit B [Elusimicrobiaceae bacterium]
MDKLITPDFGLMFWTVVNFVILLFVLGRFAWKPILSALEARERHMRSERQGAENARAEAEKIRDELNARLSSMAEQEARRLAETEAAACRRKDVIMADAAEQARQLLDRAKLELEQEKTRLVSELRTEVSALALSAAEKLMRKQADREMHRQAVAELFDQLESKK